MAAMKTSTSRPPRAGESNRANTFEAKSGATRCCRVRTAIKMMRFTLCILALAALLTAQPPAERPFRIIQLDPALADIISSDAKLETLGDHFGLTEGPVWVQHGNG